MKKLLFAPFLFMALVSLVGCGGSSPAPSAPITKQFRLDVSEIVFLESYDANVSAYHTAEEFSAIIKGNLTKILSDKNLLSDDATMHVLKISGQYMRRYMGDATPLKSTAMGYPDYMYAIEIIDGDGTVLRNYKSGFKKYKGGFLQNLKGLAGFRSKDDEIVFFQAFVDEISSGVDGVTD